MNCRNVDIISTIYLDLEIYRRESPTILSYPCDYGKADCGVHHHEDSVSHTKADQATPSCKSPTQAS